MGNIRIFENAEFGSVRTVDVDGVIHFVGKDVADILGYGNSRDALAKHVDEDDKADVAIHDGRQNRNMTVITESGLYSLVLSSKLPTAKKFKRWVTSEILPTIRKTYTELENISFKGNIDGIVYSKNGVPITTSRIISEVTGKEHNHILRDIREEILKLKEIDCPNLDSEIKDIIKDFKETEYLATNGQMYKEYELGEMATMQLMLKYSTEYRAKFIICFSKMKKSIMNMFKAKVIENVLPQDNRNRQYIYVIKNPENDRVKIGVSNNVEKRLHTLETGAGTKLDLVYQSVICSNAFDIENTVHKHFDEYRIFGEWFEVDVNKVINYLEQQEYILKSEFLKYIDITEKNKRKI